MTTTKTAPKTRVEAKNNFFYTIHRAPFEKQIVLRIFVWFLFSQCVCIHPNVHRPTVFNGVNLVLAHVSDGFEFELVAFQYNCCLLLRLSSFWHAADSTREHLCTCAYVFRDSFRFRFPPIARLTS